MCYSAYTPDSGECKRPVGKDPSCWGVEEVVWFIKDADPQALGPHADAFRRHVSRGYFILQVMSIDCTVGLNLLGREIPCETLRLVIFQSFMSQL